MLRLQPGEGCGELAATLHNNRTVIVEFMSHGGKKTLPEHKSSIGEVPLPAFRA